MVFLVCGAEQGHLEQPKEGNKSINQANAVAGNWLRIKCQTRVYNVHCQQIELEILKPNGEFLSSGQAWRNWSYQIWGCCGLTEGQLQTVFADKCSIDELLCQLALMDLNEIRNVGP